MQLIFPVLELLGVSNAIGMVGGGKIYAFGRGLTEGFTEQAFNTMMDRWTSFFNLEPATYHAVKMIMKVEAILRWVDEKMSLLKEYVTTEVANLLLNRFIRVAVDAGTGLIALLNNLYFLDYERAKGFLEIYADLAHEPVPAQADWDRLRHKHFLETFRHWEQVVKEEAEDIADIYNDAQKCVERARWVAKGVEVAIMVDVLSAGGLLPLMVTALRNVARGVAAFGKSRPGKVAVGGLVVATVLDNDFREEVVEFLEDFGHAAKYLATPATFAWGTEDRMRRFGQLLGLIIASLVVSRAVVKEGKWKERWAAAKGKAPAKFVKVVGKHLLVTQLNVNLLLPAIKLALFHHVQLIEQVIAESKQSFVDLEQKIEDILLGDPCFRDIIEVDEGLTLPKILAIVKEVNQVLKVWLDRLAAIPGWGERIAEIGARLKSIAPSQMPTLEDIRDGKLTEEEFLREAFMFVVLSHLQGALSWIAQALEEMLTPVDPKAKNPVSVAFVMQTLGFNLEEAEATELLDRNFDEVFA